MSKLKQYIPFAYGKNRSLHHKVMRYVMLLFLVLVFSADFVRGQTTEHQDKITASPAYGTDCDYYAYAPVTGKDKRYYLNKCWAEKANTAVLKESYVKCYYKSTDVYTWPIERVCNPVAAAGDTVPPLPLNDGTLLYTYYGKKFRGTPNTCRCLPADAKILTPEGEIPISMLSPGDIVWTTDKKGKRIEAPVVLINKVKVSGDHQMLFIGLADGRILKATPQHPSASANTPVDKSETGDILDGSTITKKYYFRYTEGFTYDILPGGQTGNYWANGILIGSTLTGSNIFLTGKY